LRKVHIVGKSSTEIMENATGRRGVKIQRHSDVVETQPAVGVIVASDFMGVL